MQSSFKLSCWRDLSCLHVSSPSSNHATSIWMHTGSTFRISKLKQENSWMLQCMKLTKVKTDLMQSGPPEPHRHGLKPLPQKTQTPHFWSYHFLPFCEFIASSDNHNRVTDLQHCHIILVCGIFCIYGSIHQCHFIPPVSYSACLHSIASTLLLIGSLNHNEKTTWLK